MEKLTAPKLPKGFRFKVRNCSDPEYVAIELQKKGWFFWNEVHTEWASPWDYAILEKMEKLVTKARTHTTKFNGTYPPRETL